MISSRLNVLACQRICIPEIHTEEGEQMLKPFCNQCFGAGTGKCQKEDSVRFGRSIFILKKTGLKPTLEIKEAKK